MSGKEKQPDKNYPNWGGHRPGTGRPAVKTTVRVGQRYLLTETCSDGTLPGRIVEVVAVKRNIIELQTEDGFILTLRR